MIFGYLMLVIAITISAIAAWYSVAGLTAIFAAAVIPVIIMGASLEAGKIVATVWLHNNWERAGWVYKTYLVPAIVALMLLTSMGIFGFLSKGHADQSIVSGDSMSRVAIYDEKIATEKDNIAQAKRALEQMNTQVDQMLGRTDTDRGAERAVQIRKNQSRERKALQDEIGRAQKTIAQLQAERAPLAAEFRKVEAEVGPIKYIAALIYGDNPDANVLERAVRWVIILIVVVFDPLALCLILAANKQLEWARAGVGGWVHRKQESEATEPVAQTAAIKEPPPPDEIAVPAAPLEVTAEEEEAFNAIAPVTDAVAELEKSEPELEDIPVLENEEMWSQRVIDEQQRAEEEAFNAIAPVTLAVTPNEFFAALNAEVARENIEDEQADIVEANTLIAEIEPEESEVFFETQTEPELLTPEHKEFIEKAAVAIVDLGNELDNKKLAINDLQQDYNDLEERSRTSLERNFGLTQQLEALQLQVAEIETARNVEQARANNLSAQLEELMHPIKPIVAVEALADDVELRTAPSSSFGAGFPSAASKGDLFLRTDYLPTRLFKYSGSQWFELDKPNTDSYAYNDQYIEYLIEKLKTGEYDSDELSETEHEQIAQYLQGRNATK